MGTGSFSCSCCHCSALEVVPYTCRTHGTHRMTSGPFGSTAANLVQSVVCSPSSSLSLSPLQILGQEAGEPRQRGARGRRPQPGGGRLLVLDSVLRHLPAGGAKAAQRRAAVQDAARRRVSAHHVRQTPQVRMTPHSCSLRPLPVRKHVRILHFLKKRANFANL